MIIFIRSIIIILIGLTAQYVHAQTAVKDLQIDYKASHRSIVNIIEDLERKYDINFAYASESFGQIHLDVNFEKQSLGAVLDLLTAQNNLEYKVFDGVIMLRKSNDYSDLVSTENYKTSYHLKGKVIELEKDTPMAFASISVANSTIGTYTDETGNFDIEIPAAYAESDLIIQYLGYDDQQYKIKEAVDEFLLIPLNVSAYSISEIMIVNRDLDIRVSNKDQAMMISESQIQNTTSGLAGNDLAKNLQLLPGISATDDASADIKIRGSNNDETLLILDGIPIYNASHYYGIFSAVNSNYIESINLYKNAFPIHYGGKTAGVVEMLSKNNIAQKPSLSAEVNLLTASVNVDLPITKKSSLSLSGRSTIGDVSNTKFNALTSRPLNEVVRTQNFSDNTATSQADPNFSFNDINAKFLWIPNEKSSISFNYYSSNDDFSLSSGLTRLNMQEQRIDLKTDNEEHWNNLGLSAIIKTTFGNGLNFDSRFFYSKYDNNNLTDLNIKNERARVMDLQVIASQSNQIQDIGLNTKASKKFGAYDLTAGLDAIQHDVVYQFSENKTDNLIGNDQVAEFAPYAALDLQMTDKLSFNLGARSSYYEGTQKSYLSPRTSFNYVASEKLKLKGSYSHNQQFIRELNYEYRGQPYQLWVSADQQEIPIIESTNLMLGGTMSFGRFLLDVELYQKNMTGMIEYVVLAPTGMPDGGPPGQLPQENMTSNYDLFTGVGRSKGIDILLSSNFKNYDTYLSYTLSKTEESFEEIRRGEYFASEDDRTHQLKWINEYHIGNLSLGANWIFSTGRLYTDLTAFGNNEDVRSIPTSQRNKRLPSYQRLDLSTAYKLKFGDNKLTLGLSLFNALDRQNVQYEQLIESRPKDDKKPLNSVVGTTSNLLSRTLNLSFKFDLN